jgi:hypothetical protein
MPPDRIERENIVPIDPSAAPPHRTDSLRKVPGRASDNPISTPRCPAPRRRKAPTVIILGIILIVLGYLLPVPSIIVTIGWILLVVGLILTLLGAVGRPVGRKTYF